MTLNQNRVCGPVRAIRRLVSRTIVNVIAIDKGIFRRMDNEMTSKELTITIFVTILVVMKVKEK